MTFMQTSRNSNAAIANLMALLAISAYHLAHQKTLEHSPDVSYWRKIGSLASQQAKEHLQISLKTEVSGEGHAKYKDQVMALSAMLAFAVRTGFLLLQSLFALTSIRYSMTDRKKLEPI